MGIIKPIVRKAKRVGEEIKSIEPMVEKIDLNNYRWHILGVFAVVAFVAMAASIILLFA